MYVRIFLCCKQNITLNSESTRSYYIKKKLIANEIDRQEKIYMRQRIDAQ